MSFDDFIKQLFKDQYGDAIKSQVNVGALEKSFDLWVLGNHPVILSSNAIPLLFKQYKDNIIEHKSGHDIYELNDMLKLLGDFSYFSFNRKLTLKEAFQNSCLWFIIVNSQPFLKQYEENDIVRDAENGYYYHKKCCPDLRIIVINELDVDKEENQLLLLLSSGEKFRSFLQKLQRADEIPNHIQKYLTLKFIIESKELKNMEEVQELKKKFSFEENIKFGIEELGIDKVIAAVGIDKVIAAVGIEKMLQNVELDQLEEIVEKRKKLKK